MIVGMMCNPMLFSQKTTVRLLAVEGPLLNKKKNTKNARAQKTTVRLMAVEGPQKTTGTDLQLPQTIA